MKSTIKKFNAQWHLAIAQFVLIALTSCSEQMFQARVIDNQPKDRFLSATYNHFEGGVLFKDVEFGLKVLWEASFKNRQAYKENLGFFVPDGFLILPNKGNTIKRSRLDALPNQTGNNRLFVQFEGRVLQVLGIIHTHPDIYSVRMPSPGNDYQYGYLGIHNYVMDHLDLFDAYKDSGGNEVYERLGSRNAISRIVLNTPRDPAHIDLAFLPNDYAREYRSDLIPVHTGTQGAISWLQAVNKP